MNIQLFQRNAQQQTLVMTQQMQQAIALLQLSNTDLQSYIDKEAEENPYIALDHAPRPLPSLPYSGTASTEWDDPASRLSNGPLSLYAHVAAQFDLMFADPTDRFVADRFLEALDPSGWLGEPLDVIAADCHMTQPEAQDMLRRVQDVEPAGLFARDLAECLALQAEDRGMMTPVFRCLLDHLQRLAAADLNGLTRVCQCSMEKLRDALKQLRSLNPKPGADFVQETTLEREPDLIVTRGKTGWQVELNRSTLPSVQIDEPRAVHNGRNPASHDYVTERLNVARWLRRAVDHRNQTTLAVGVEIMRRQIGFLDHGPAHLAPMTLADVAQAIGVHESTVSRVTTGLLMATPQGTFALKRFFGASLPNDADSENPSSAAAVRYQVQKLIDAEDPAAPLSDDAIAHTISSGGPVLARRTVAKYRDMLGIPSSFARRRQGKLKAA